MNKILAIKRASASRVSARPQSGLQFTSINGRRIAVSKNVKLRPEKFPIRSEEFTQTIYKAELNDYLFEGTSTAKRTLIQDQNSSSTNQCVVFTYQFSQPSKQMVFIPSDFGELVSQKYMCRDCFRVYTILSFKQRDIDPLPTVAPNELDPLFDPRTMGHYCVHYELLRPEINYFNEYESKLEIKLGSSLLDCTFVIGLFLNKLIIIHKKVTDFLNSTKPLTLNQLTDYVMSLECRHIKSEPLAVSFLYCFQLFHETNKKNNPILQDTSLLQKLLQQAEPHVEAVSAPKTEMTWDELISEGGLMRDEESTSSINDPADIEQLKRSFKANSYKPNCNKQAKYKRVLVRDEELLPVINNTIDYTTINTDAEEFLESAKKLRPLILYYAPTRITQFEHVIKEVHKIMEQ